MTGLTSSSRSTRSPIITSIPPSPLVIASHPPKPNGVGVAIPSIMTFRSFRGMLIFNTPSLKSPCFPRVAKTCWYSCGTAGAWARTTLPVHGRVESARETVINRDVVFICSSKFTGPLTPSTSSSYESSPLLDGLDEQHLHAALRHERARYGYLLAHLLQQ